MEAASVSRRVRLEELKRRKAVVASGHVTAQSNGNAAVEPIAMQLHFDEDDEKLASDETAADLDALARHVAAWPTAKLVRSFRVLDRKQTRVEYGKLRDTIEADIEGMQELAIAEHEATRNEQLALHNIAPRRANWDLKRDMLKRLAKLQRRDRQARLTLIRQRVSAAAAASTGTTAQDGEGASANSAQAAVAAGALGNGLMPEVGTESGSEEEDA